MRRSLPLVLTGAAALLAVACRDSALAPVRAPEAARSASSAPMLGRHGGSDKTVLGTIDISPEGGSYRIGSFDLNIPAGAVCDPRTTKYGRRYWDADCTPANRTIRVSAVAVSRNGETTVDFRPDLRFRPAAGWVTISTDEFSDLLLSDAVRQLAPSSSFFESFAVLYVPSNSKSKVNEFRELRDPTLVTHVDLVSGKVWRRIKHFSGYFVGSGSCEPSLENNCLGDVAGGLGGGGVSVDTQ
jgi:hypothetical protein